MREKSAFEEKRSTIKNSPVRIHTQAKEERGMSRKREATETSTTEAESSPTKRTSRTTTTNTTLAPLSITTSVVGRNTPFQEPLFASPKGRSSTSNTTSSKDNTRKFQVSYKPEGFWIAKERKCTKEIATTTASNSTEKKCFYISTSYVPLGLSIDIGNSFTKEIEIGCHNVSKIRVLYKGEESNKDGTGPKMTVKDMDIDQYDDLESSIDENDNDNHRGHSSSSSSSSALMQRIVLNTPYPCQAVEVLILNRTREFVSIFYVQSFASNIRSSSQSTPVTKPNHPDKNKKITQLMR